MEGTMKLYFFPISQPSRSILMLCREAGIPYESCVVNIMAGEQKAEEYIAINPMGAVPTIVEGDFVLSEGCAILAYLCESRGLTNWYPTDPKVRARLSTSGILVPTLMKSEILEATRAQFEKGLTILDGHLATHDFVAGTSTPTIADLILVPELDQQLSDAFGLVDLSSYLHIQRYLSAFSSAVPSHQEIFAPVVALVAGMRAPPSAPSETEVANSSPIAICTKCGKGDNVIPCIRGRPGAELIAKAKAGLVHLGGCTEGPAKGWCKNCEEYVLE